MHRCLVALVCGLGLVTVGGCNPMTDLEPAPPRTQSAPTGDRRPAPAPTRTASGGSFEIKWDTQRDRTYAEFLRDHSGGMLRGARVGVERKGLVEVKLDRSVPPDDTLDLTKSLIQGIRKDFPDKTFQLKVYDPNGKAILTAHASPNRDVRYQIAHDDRNKTQRADDDPTPSGSVATTPETSQPTGETPADRKYAAWAQEHGKAYLRYVEADLENHGRLWFGVTREVKPGDVKDLTRSVLEGAQKAFPHRDLTATVFDPTGDRIGRAVLPRNGGAIRWEQ